MVSIQIVELYFEPLGAYKRAMNSGSEVHIPLRRGIPKAIQTADSFLGFNGKLIEFTSGKNLQVKNMKEQPDRIWGLFLDMSAHTLARRHGVEGLQWKRWNAETTQGRWNVVVFGTGMY